MNKIILLVFAISFFTTNIDTTQAQSSPDEIITSFFKLYEEKGADDAVNYVFSTNKWMAKNQDGIMNLRTQLKSLINIVGKYHGHEEIIKTSIGSNYLLSHHMVRYERQPVRFSFLFYRPGDKWQVQNFQYDDEMDDELREATKLYRLTHESK